MIYLGEIRAVYVVPNQKMVRCHNPSTTLTEGNDFDVVIHSIDSQAMSDLSGNGYKLYAYFRKNKDGYTFALSPADACAYTGLKDKAYHAAVKELIEKHYLTENGEGTNLYDFSIIAQKAGQTVTPQEGQRHPIEGKPSTQERDSVYLLQVDRTPQTGREIIYNNTDNSIKNNTDDSTIQSINKWEAEDEELPF